MAHAAGRHQEEAEPSQRRAHRGEQEIYVLGLDYHVGFVVREGEEVYFVHSDYIGRSGVKREKLNESRAIQASKSYVIGSLTTNKSLLKKWSEK